MKGDRAGMARKFRKTSRPPGGFRFSKQWLQTEYWYYNRTYFRGKLPEVEIFFADWYLGRTSRKRFESRYAGATAFFNKPDLPIIVLSTKLRLTFQFVSATLLHEMIHIKIGPRHGRKFKREKRRLILAGAFDDLL